eukprot:6283048-Ditylum_brightwellii.AAC.1
MAGSDPKRSRIAGYLPKQKEDLLAADSKGFLLQNISLPWQILMGLQHVMKGNAVAMAVAGRALLYGAERDMSVARNGDSSNASDSFVMALSSPVPNSAVCNDTEDVLCSNSNDDLSSGVAYVPSEPSEQSERNEYEPSEQSGRNEDASAEASQASSTEAAATTPVPSSKQRRWFAFTYKSFVASAEFFWHQHVNVTSEVMFVHSGT